MSGKRMERVGHQLRDEISRYLQRGLLKDPRIGFVTISGVRVSKDLRHAKVFISVFGEEDAQGSVDALQRAQGFLRRQLGKDLRIRRVPDLTFILDSSIEQGVQIAQVLQDLPEIQREREAEVKDDGPELDADGNPIEPEPELDEETLLAQQTIKDWQPLVDVIRKGQRFLVAAHREPDGDALGSTTALVGILKKLGKETVLFNDKEYPPHFSFLPFADEMITDLSTQAPFDVTILCDCGEADRAPNGFPKDPETRGTFLVIDHHLTSRLEGEFCYNDPMCPAVGVLIYDLAKALDVELDIDIATGMYCAIVSDTGSFRYEKTNPHTFRAAAELLETGINPWEVASSLFESNPIERQRLLARTLDTIELHADGQLAFLTVTKQMIQQVGATPAMTDGFVNLGRGVSGVEVAVLFREEFEHWKISFRSRGKVNVATIAQPLGGGGHHNAAGATFAGSLQEIKDQIVRSLTDNLDSPQ